MDSSIIYRLLLVLFIFTFSQVQAIEFQGNFTQGHFILGKTDTMKFSSEFRSHILSHALSFHEKFGEGSGNTPPVSENKHSTQNTWPRTLT